MPNFWIKNRQRKDTHKQVGLIISGAPTLHTVVAIGMSYVIIDPHKIDKEIIWLAAEPLVILGYTVLKDGIAVWSQHYSTPLRVITGDTIRLKFSDADIYAIQTL